MPKIIIQNLRNKEIFTKNENKILLDIIHENYIDWMHACGGKGRCTTCKAKVISGSENLSPETAAETKFRNMKKLGKNERLSCQSKVIGDIRVEVATENKFAHLIYSD